MCSIPASASWWLPAVSSKARRRCPCRWPARIRRRNPGIASERRMTRKTWLWIVLLAASLASAVAMLRHRDALFPLLDVDVSMTRDEALGKARSIAEALKLTPAKVTRAAAAFQGDP